MFGFLGNTFMKQNQNVNGSAFDHVDFIGLYFSAIWCYPCRKFTPKLDEFYAEVNKDRKKIEILFVSKDKSMQEFLHYYKHMRFLAIPYEDSDRIKSLFRIFRVQGLPSLVILDNKGRLITQDGKNIILELDTGAYDKFMSIKKELYPDEHAKKWF